MGAKVRRVGKEEYVKVIVVVPPEAVVEGKDADEKMQRSVVAIYTVDEARVVGGWRRGFLNTKRRVCGLPWHWPMQSRHRSEQRRRRGEARRSVTILPR